MSVAGRLIVAGRFVSLFERFLGTAEMIMAVFAGLPQGNKGEKGRLICSGQR